MGALWHSLTVEFMGGEEGFNGQLDAFLSLLRMLMCKGEVRLAHNGVFLTGGIDEQLHNLRCKWPGGKDGLEADMDLWFLIDAPAGIVWITPEGEVWT